MMRNNVLDSFIDKEVLIELEDNTILMGKILNFQRANNTNHLPPVLIIENQSGKHILRGKFFSIKEANGE